MCCQEHRWCHWSRLTRVDWLWPALNTSISTSFALLTFIESRLRMRFFSTVWKMTSLLVSKHHNKMGLQKGKIGISKTKLEHYCFKRMFQNIFGKRLSSHQHILLINNLLESWGPRVLWMLFLHSIWTCPLPLIFHHKSLGVSHLSMFMVMIGENLTLEL